MVISILLHVYGWKQVATISEDYEIQLPETPEEVINLCQFLSIS
jgi:hypothetical protein